MLGIGDSKPRSVNSKLKTLDSLHKKSQKIDNRSSLKTLNISENWNTKSFGLAELFGDADKFGYTTKPMQGKVSLGKTIYVNLLGIGKAIKIYDIVRRFLQLLQ